MLVARVADAAVGEEGDAAEQEAREEARRELQFSRLKQRERGNGID